MTRKSNAGTSESPLLQWRTLDAGYAAEVLPGHVVGVKASHESKTYCGPAELPATVFKVWVTSDLENSL